ncbi:MAG TPA: GNAT family N-acetyltransferase [Pyrinomonadaceae bacterium]|jgi:ribosomal protein S18 acetylase RimI-like enzyme|nr:GNAT family N-acetyltransferase [Pyrinomonadaceae bacterium]
MVEIVRHERGYAESFAALNYEWIEKFFAVETHDRDILDDPERWVIEPGGEIFMAVADGLAVGTVALIPAADGILELTKMAVSPAFQGQGIADRLIDACIGFAQDTGTLTIFLESHTKLAPALNLYRKHGFIEVPGDPDSLYSRADIRMELAIDPTTR